jgi:hypothetical protein
VYYLNSNNELQELIYSPSGSHSSPEAAQKNSNGDGFWTPGSLNAAHFQVAPYSDIAVFVLDDSTSGIQINLYAQQVNNVIQEYQLHSESKQHPSRVHVALLKLMRDAASEWGLGHKQNV